MEMGVVCMYRHCPAQYNTHTCAKASWCAMAEIVQRGARMTPIRCQRDVLRARLQVCTRCAQMCMNTKTTEATYMYIYGPASNSCGANPTSDCAKFVGEGRIGPGECSNHFRDIPGGVGTPSSWVGQAATRRLPRHQHVSYKAKRFCGRVAHAYGRPRTD